MLYGTFLHRGIDKAWHFPEMRQKSKLEVDVCGTSSTNELSLSTDVS